MTAPVLATSLVLGLALSAVAGPAVLGRAAPALMRLPRLAIGLLLGAIMAWVLALLALGPILAWIVSGPALLPGGAADVCQRCLAAANPFTTSPIDTAVPVAALVVLPAAAAVLQAVSGAIEFRRRRRGRMRTAAHFGECSTPRELQGVAVLVANDARPYAFALPRRNGGIVLSSGALDLLTAQEVAAVLAHERAHLREHHHLITAIVTSLTRRLRWVPLLAAAEDALAHYLEIAADDDARRQVGTPALASALLTLGENVHADTALDGVLHALGPDRIRHLVRPRTGRSGILSTVAGACCLATLALLGAAVHLPYAVAAFSGCL